MARHVSVVAILAITALLFLSLRSFGDKTGVATQVFNAPAAAAPKADSAQVAPPPGGDIGGEAKMAGIDTSSSFLTGSAIAPKLENATAKYVASRRVNQGVRSHALTILCLGPNSVVHPGSFSTP